MRELTAMPSNAYTLGSGSDVMNYLVQNNDILANGINGQVFTRDNFVELSNIIVNNQNLRTQFLFELYDKIGLTYVASNAYYNQLKFLKKDVLNNGDIVDELAIDLIEPMPYNPEVNWQLTMKNFMPTYAEFFHKLNRAQVYPMSVNETLLKRAMTSEQAFIEFLNQQMQTLYASNEADEFDYFLQDIHYIASNRAFPVQANALGNGDDFKEFVALINTYANNLSFVSRDYNMLNFKRATPLERLVFVTTSEVAAQMNVYVNAPAYNLEFVKLLAERTIVVPSLPTNCVGLLMDDRVAQIYDVVYATDNNHNGLTRTENYFLHVQQIISSSLQFNAIAFYTVIEQPTQITDVTPSDTTVLVKGQTYPIKATVDKGYKQLKYQIVGNTDENTQITPYGLLYVGQNEQASALNVIITGQNSVTKTMTYYVRGNDPVITNLYPVEGSVLTKGQSYQLTWKLSKGNAKPVFEVTYPTGVTTGVSVTDDGLVSIVKGYTGTEVTIVASVGSSSVSNTYKVE